MGYCYLCELEREEDVDVVCSGCLKRYECKTHGQEGDVNCWECRERLQDVIHVSTIAMKKKIKREEDSSFE